MLDMIRNLGLRFSIASRSTIAGRKGRMIQYLDRIVCLLTDRSYDISVEENYSCNPQHVLSTLLHALFSDGFACRDVE